MKTIYRNKGFSLLELMIVIAIAGILATLAIPSWFAWRATAKINGAATNLRGDLEMAKMRAIKENVLVGIKFFANNYYIFLDNGSGSNAGNWNKDGDEIYLRERQLPPGVTASNINFHQDRTGFNGRSIVPPDKNGHAQEGDITITHFSGKQRQIFVNLIGRISLQY